MKSDVLARSELLTYPLVAALLFVVVFALAVAWVYRRGSGEVYARRARLVFDDGTAGAPQSPKEVDRG